MLVTQRTFRLTPKLSTYSTVLQTHLEFTLYSMPRDLWDRSANVKLNWPSRLQTKEKNISK